MASKSTLLKFKKITPSKSRSIFKKHIEPHMVKLSLQPTYTIKFLNRDLIFAFNKEFSAALITEISSKRGILGMILEYNDENDSYDDNKIVMSAPMSNGKISFEIANLQGKALYSGIGKISNKGIKFKITGKSVEGPIRSIITGNINNHGVIFHKSSMPNKNYKKIQSPKRLPDEIHV